MLLISLVLLPWFYFKVRSVFIFFFLYFPAFCAVGAAYHVPRPTYNGTTGRKVANKPLNMPRPGQPSTSPIFVPPPCPAPSLNVELKLKLALHWPPSSQPQVRRSKAGWVCADRGIPQKALHTCWRHSTLELASKEIDAVALISNRSSWHLADGIGIRSIYNPYSKNYPL